MNDLINFIRHDWKDFLETCLFLSGFLFVLYLLTCLYAYNVQSTVYSQDIPRGMICIKDTVPHAYLCAPDQEVPWYLSSEGVLAHVE